DILASYGARSTKEANAFDADAREKGQIPHTEAEFASINAAAEAVIAHPGARHQFSQPGAGEVSVFAADPETGVEVRGRCDFLPTDFTLGAPSRVAVDLKTARDASPKGFTKAIAEHGYDVQGVWYPDILHWL